MHSGPEDGLVKLSYYSYWSSEGICVCVSFLCVFFFFSFPLLFTWCFCCLDEKGN